jgi:hypothetical protein
VKRLLAVFAIAIVGAGMAYAATTVFFSPSSSRLEFGEPQGLIDSIDLDDPEPTATPEATTTPSPAPASGSDPAAAAPAPAPQPTPEVKRVPHGETSGPATYSVSQGTNATDEEPEDPCADEDSELERDRCERELEREEEEEEQAQE